MQSATTFQNQIYEFNLKILQYLYFTKHIDDAKKISRLNAPGFNDLVVA